ncbi:MAG: hypothetical protein COB46_00205 [Rhodospirillaceae bacterium]|nr:MAG: hypothetical protein COB46_00205 [Rhodospirillaceae bacterium]
MKNTNVAFVNLPAKWTGRASGGYYENKAEIKKTPQAPYGLPLGLLYVSSFLKKNCENVGKIGLIDYQTEMIGADDYKDVDEFIDKCALKNIDFKPDIVGFSVMFSSTHHFLVRCVERLKVIWPDAVFVIGGIHATNFSEVLLKKEAIDYVIRGEGEQAFKEFLDNFNDPEALLNIKGVYNQTKIEQGGCLIITDYMQDLDEIPYPDWDLVDMESYSSEASNMRRMEFDDQDKSIETHAAILMSSRGCPYRCIFCSSHTVHGRKMRYRSAGNVIAEMKELNRIFGINAYIFEDDMFICHPGKARELLTAIIKLKKTIPGFEIHFPNALAVNVMQDDILDLLVEAGMRITIIAVESGSSYVQTEILHKGVNLDKAKHVVSYLRNKGVVVRTSFILGFPNETRAMMQETIDYCIDLKADWCNINVAQPLVGTDMYQEFDEQGVLPQAELLWDNSLDKAAGFQDKQAMGGRSFDTPEISADDLLKLQYRANLIINFVNNVNLLEEKYDVAEKLFEGIVQAYDFHIVAWASLKKVKEALGKTAEASKIDARIKELAISDPKAKEMLESYHDLMPEYAELVA